MGVGVVVSTSDRTAAGLVAAVDEPETAQLVSFVAPIPTSPRPMMAARTWLRVGRRIMLDTFINEV
jgi:hypothetical protein